MLSKNEIGDNIANQLVSAYITHRNGSLGPSAPWTNEDTHNMNTLQSIGRALAQRGVEIGHLVASDYKEEFERAISQPRPQGKERIARSVPASGDTAEVYQPDPPAASEVSRRRGRPAPAVDALEATDEGEADTGGGGAEIYRPEKD